MTAQIGLRHTLAPLLLRLLLLLPPWALRDAAGERRPRLTQLINRSSSVRPSLGPAALAASPRLTSHDHPRIDFSSDYLDGLSVQRRARAERSRAGRAERRRRRVGHIPAGSPRRRSAGSARLLQAIKSQCYRQRAARRLAY